MHNDVALIIDMVQFVVGKGTQTKNIVLLEWYRNHQHMCCSSSDQYIDSCFTWYSLTVDIFVRMLYCVYSRWSWSWTFALLSMGHDSGDDFSQKWSRYPDSKNHRANMGPIWGRQDPGGPHVSPMNFPIWVDARHDIGDSDEYWAFDSEYIDTCIRNFCKGYWQYNADD